MAVLLGINTILEYHVNRCDDAENCKIGDKHFPKRSPF